MKKKELEERVIVLEGVVQAYAELISQFIEQCPLPLSAFDQLDQFSVALYNSAGVREGIEDLVELNIKYEKTNEDS
jgi:hypothetical protein